MTVASRVRGTHQERVFPHSEFRSFLFHLLGFLMIQLEESEQHTMSLDKSANNALYSFMWTVAPTQRNTGDVTEHV